MTQPSTPPEPYDGYAKYRQQEAETYEREREREPVWDKENAFVREHFAGHRVGRLLDAPVGTGRFLPYYSRETQIVGLDVSEAMLEQAKARLDSLDLPHARLMQGDIFQLNFPDGHFDSIVCWRLLHLLPPERLAAAIAEMARALRGELLLQVYARGTWPHRVAWHLWRRLAPLLGMARAVRTNPAWAHIRAYSHTHSAVETAATAAGLRGRSRHFLGHYYSQELWIYVLEKA